MRGGRQLEAEIGHSGFILADFVPPATAEVPIQIAVTIVY
jgi:hypothetical protein